MDDHRSESSSYGHIRRLQGRITILYVDAGARQTADLAELTDWVEGLRAAAHTARREGNITLAKALDITRFEVYESYLDEDYTNNKAKRLMIKN
jgi:hypothetical protein